MPITALSIPIAPRGLATAFEASETPTSYALKMRNRFISAAGGAEKRQGMTQLGNSIATAVDRLHELVNNKTAVETLFASGGGKIYKFDGSTSWAVVYSLGTSTAKYRSVQVNDKLIFYNGVDRPIYTKDGTTFYELRALVDAGLAATGTDRDSLQGEHVSDWIRTTDVAVGDIIQYEPTGAIACITAVATVSLGHTQISSTAPSDAGILADGYVLVGKAYKILDMVENNIIPTSDPEYFDNIAVADTGTSTTGIKVSGMSNWPSYISVGDYVRNTTRSAIARVTAVTSSQIRVTGVSAQVAGDSLIFYKTAMPRPSFVHVHYGRTYYVDANDKTKIRISGPNNPQDLTTDAGTLDSSSVSFGALQPEGDAIQAMTSYQRFLGITGKRYTFLYEGTDPISDTSAMDSDFRVVGMFPQGTMSPDAFITVGNDAVIVSRDGIQSFSLQADNSSLSRENLSEAIKNELRIKIASANENDIMAFHYPKRSWVCFRIGDQLYVYNYTPFFGEGAASSEKAFQPAAKGGSWSIFDGLIAEQSHYFVRRDGSLYSCKGNKVYVCDADGVYTDDGAKYTTEYQTAWLKGDVSTSQNIKVGHYIQLLTNAVGTTYTVRAAAPFSFESNDEAMSEANARTGPIGIAVIGSYAVGGEGTGGISDVKYPLIWRGKEVRFTISTYDDGGPDIIAKLIVFFTMSGVR